MNSRSLALPISLILPAAALGYLLGGSGPPGPPAAAAQTLSPPSVPPGGGAGAGTWRTALAKARSAPASKSEQEWVKWAFAVPDGDIARAVAGLNPRTDLHALRLLFSRWVKRDPQAAWQAFDALPIPSKSVRWYEGGGSHGNGLSLVNSRLQNDPRGLILGRMLRAWHRVDPVASIAHAEKLRAARKKDPLAGGGSMAGYEIGRFLDDSGSPGDGGGISPAARTGQDWRDAMELAEAKKKEDPTGSSSYQTMSKWAAESPEAAARWLLDLPAGRRSDPATHNYLLLLSKAPPALRMELFGTFAAELTGLEAAVDVFNPIQRGTEGMHPGQYMELQQLRFGSDALKDWFAGSPAEAKAWLAAQPDSALKSLLYGQAAGLLSRTSPNEAIALLAGVPDADLPNAVAGLASGWARTDAAACAEWVAKIDDIPTRDMSQAAIARQVMSADPALALKLSLGIADESARTKLRQEVTQGLNWNPAALRKIIASDPALQAALGQSAGSGP